MRCHCLGRAFLAALAVIVFLAPPVLCFGGSLADEIARINAALASSGPGHREERETILENISLRYRISRERLEGLLEVISPGEATVVFIVAERSGSKRKDIIEMRLNGLPWAEILSATGVAEEDVVRDIRRVRRDLGC